MAKKQKTRDMNQEINHSEDELLELDESLVEEEFIEIFLIIKISNAVYALQYSHIKEILHNPKLDVLPFVPSYIAGVINRHGEPIVLFDPNILFGYEKQVHTITIIIENEETFGLIVSEIQSFERVKLSELSYDSMFVSQFYSYSIFLDGKEVRVINPHAFLEYLSKDLLNR